MEYPTRGAAAMLSLRARALGRRQFLLSAAGMGALALSVADGASARAAGGVSLGAWTAGMDVKPALLDKLSSTLGQPLGIASVFRGEHDVWPGPVESQLAGKARTLLVSWHLDSRSFSYWASPAAQPYLSSVARRVKAYRRPVAIRPWAEMNGDWQPWRPTAQPTDGYASGYAAFMQPGERWLGCFGPRELRTPAGSSTPRPTATPRRPTCVSSGRAATLWTFSAYGYNWGTGGIFTWRSFADMRCDLGAVG